MPEYLANDTIGLITFWQYESTGTFQRNNSFIVPEPKAFYDTMRVNNINDRISYLHTGRDGEVFFFCQEARKSDNKVQL